MAEDMAEPSTNAFEELTYHEKSMGLSVDLSQEEWNAIVNLFPPMRAFIERLEPYAALRLPTSQAEETSSKQHLQQYQWIFVDPKSSHNTATSDSWYFFMNQCQERGDGHSELTFASTPMIKKRAVSI